MKTILANVAVRRKGETEKKRKNAIMIIMTRVLNKFREGNINA